MNLNSMLWISSLLIKYIFVMLVRPVEIIRCNGEGHRLRAVPRFQYNTTLKSHIKWIIFFKRALLSVLSNILAATKGWLSTLCCWEAAVHTHDQSWKKMDVKMMMMILNNFQNKWWWWWWWESRIRLSHAIQVGHCKSGTQKSLMNI